MGSKKDLKQKRTIVVQKNWWRNCKKKNSYDLKQKC